MHARVVTRQMLRANGGYCGVCFAYRRGHELDLFDRCLTSRCSCIDYSYWDRKRDSIDLDSKTKAINSSNEMHQENHELITSHLMIFA